MTSAVQELLKGITAQSRNLPVFSLSSLNRADLAGRGAGCSQPLLSPLHRAGEDRQGRMPPLHSQFGRGLLGLCACVAGAPCDTMSFPPPDSVYHVLC